MLIPPLSLSNFLIVGAAALCIWSTLPQLRGEAFPVWRLAVPTGIAAALACMLLNGIFDVTLGTDLAWVVSALVGGFLGRHRGYTIDLEVTPDGHSLRQGAVWDVAAVLGLLTLAAALDFVAAASHWTWLRPDEIAALAAFGAAFLFYRALALGTRLMAMRGDAPGDAGLRRRNDFHRM